MSRADGPVRHGRLQLFLQTLRHLNPSKQSIVWVLLLLIGLFIAGMWVISTLNLNFSQKAMSELREVQLEEVFYANLDRINAQHRLLENYTSDLARMGELFWHLQQQSDMQQAGEFEGALLEKLRDFPDVFGAGVWFESGAFISGGVYHGAFAYRGDTADPVLMSLAEAGIVDYRSQPWFDQAVSDSWLASDQEQQDFYWTPAYYNPVSGAAVLTLVKPMYARSGQLIGVVTTDWHAERVIDLVGQVEVTPNTFAYLIDRNNRRLSALSEIDDSEQALQVMDVILQERLVDSLNERIRTLLPGLQQRGVTMQHHQLAVDGREFELSFAATSADMLFGIGVPRDEIDAVLQPMRSSNFYILLLTGLVMLLLSGVILYKVVGLMRQLQASYTDELTDLPNRARLLLDFGREPGGSLLLINLDGFKEINGLFGHACGDYVLRVLAGWLTSFIDNNRRLGAMRLYRLTADEFAILGPDSSQQKMQNYLQALNEYLQRRSLTWQDQEITIGVTLGAAIHPPEEVIASVSQDSMITWARFALKQARLQQKNYVIYDLEQRIEDAYEHNLLWARRVKQALEDDRILPFFQPIYDNRSGRITKFECLVRMRDESGEIASPGQFLDVARKLRLDRQLTRIMVEKSLTTFADTPYEFSINLSYADLLDQDLSRFIIEKLDESGLGKRIIFEILESDGIENYQEVRRFIDEVKKRGCRIAIDDFGTGYSNFEHLLRLNVDLIKIDGSLIRNLDTDPVAFSVTQGIVNFARSLSMETVAEFVHSDSVQERVRYLGVDFSQGAYFSMPQAELVTVAAAEPVVEKE
ncbi:EAL domain-containing protein [Nitrincola sp. MINF-07-Sa-05]|uniref:EAL domain-containing protein n=1 Tax=Nitrincola salilacus TaxID=3400273 RepID=UPI0039186042